MFESSTKRRRSSATNKHLTSLGGSNKRRQSASSAALSSTVFGKWSSKETEPLIRCNSSCKYGSLSPGTGYHTTLWETFKNGLAVSCNKNCLGWRPTAAAPYQWWSYEQFAARVQALALAFARKTTLRRGDIVGIYAASSPKWLVVAYACTARSLILAPIYDTLGVDACYYIVNKTNMTIIFVDTLDVARRLLSTGAGLMPLITTMVVLEHPNDEMLEAELLRKAIKANVTIVTLDNFLMTDVSCLIDHDASAFVDGPTENDICYIVYTSGAAGPPKGVMLTHKAAVSSIMAADLFARQIEVPGSFKFGEDDVCLSFLPFSHCYSLMIANWFLYRGASIGFYSGNSGRISDDAIALKPTFVAIVPSLMNKVYGKIMAQLRENRLKAKLFWRAYAKKKELLLHGTITRDSFWDKMIFRKYQQLMGGRVSLVAVSSAPVSPDVIEFWQIVFGCLSVNCYGQTECNAVATLGIGPSCGNVGHPLSCNYVKLIDAPDGGFFAANAQGEICVKGPNVMLGYFKQPELTEEVLDEDGWLHTGDIGEFQANGALRIIDRKKSVFQLCQGAYILPEKIESVYATCPLVSQVFVDGLSTEAYPVAIVVPDQGVLNEWLARHERQASSSDPLNDVAAIELAMQILKAMREVGKNRLNSTEQVRSIYLTSDAFSPKNSLATPTMKNRRGELMRHFREKIIAMYRAGPMIDDTNNIGK